MVKRSTTLPWNTKINRIKNHKRHKDELSNEYGATIRLTYDNNILVMRTDKSPWHKEALEEFIMEIIGGPPYLALNKCYHCSKINIKPYKNTWRYELCPTCRKRDIPWRTPIR